MNYQVILSYLNKKAVGQDYLYHFTTLDALPKILKQNTLGLNKLTLNDPGIVSLTRGNLADIFTNMPVRLVFDKAKLRTNYKMQPYADPRVKVKKLEKEEQVFGPIQNLDKYLIRIDLNKTDYDQMQEKEEQKTAKRESIEQALDILNQAPDIETALKHKNKTLERYTGFTKEKAVQSLQKLLPLYSAENPLLTHPKLNVVADLKTPLYKLK